MRILFIHEVSYLDKSIYEMHEFPEHLASFGHDVTFVDFPECERLFPYRWRIRQQFVEGRAIRGAKLQLISLARRFPRPFDRLLCAATFSRTARTILSRTNPDVIVLYGVPTNGWQSIRVARHFGVPVVYRAIDSSAHIRDTIFVRLVKWAENYVFRHSNMILANNHALKMYGVQRGADPRKISVLFPGVAEFVSKAETNTPSDNCNVVFMGSLFRFSGLDWVIEGIAKSTELRRRVRLKVIGDGEDRQRLEEIVDRRNIRENVTFAGFVNFNHLYEEMSRCKVAILPFDDLEVTQVALPGKVLQYVMAGLPTVSTPLAGLESLLKEGEGVVYSERGSDFFTKISSLIDDEALSNSIVERGRSKLRLKCAWPQQALKFEEHLFRLANRQS